MRKLLLSAFAAIAAFHASAQTVATFDTFYLSKPDTFYVNYSSQGNDVGFNDGLAHFPCYYDTSFGGLWSSGFVYSNMTDSVTSGYLNQYSAKTAKGYDTSSNYAVYWQGYGVNNIVSFMGAQAFKPQGFYITNSTYAYNSMRDGDFAAKKFGGTTGNDPDWFKLTVYGYNNGSVSDSVAFYLADFRDSNNANDYIVNDWQWVNLQPLNFADSIDFLLTSSDNGSFGMNTPGYFCMDNLTVIGLSLSVNETKKDITIKAYPNPATETLFIETDETVRNILLTDISGKLISYREVNDKKISVETTSLTPGMYLLQLNNGTQTAIVRFVKQ